MNSLIDWIDDKKKSTSVLLGLTIASYVGFFISPDLPWLAVTALVVSIVAPFALFLVWVVDSSWIDRLLARRWTAILMSGVVVIYGMFANTFASDLINDLFKVDPVHFTVTNVFLTTAYLLVGIFQPFVMFPLWLAVLLMGGFVVPAFLLAGPWKQSVPRIAAFLVATLLISVSAQSMGLLKHKLPTVAEKIALRADFNEKHRCSAQWPIEVDKVVFLHDGNVLAHPRQPGEYVVLPCRPR